MLLLKGTNISIPQGESETIKIELSDELGQQMPFVQGDKVYMSVSLNSSKEEYLFKKIETQFTNGVAYIPIRTEDTINAKPRNYKYDIRISFKNNPSELVTIVKESDFIVTEAVTRNA